MANLSHQIRVLLREAPATSADVADELGISMRRAQVALWVLKDMGDAKNVSKIRREGKGHSLHLVELTRRGAIKLRRVK